MRIQFKSKRAKIIFYVVVAFLTMLNVIVVAGAFLHTTSETDLWLTIIVPFCLWGPLLLLVLAVTVPTPRKDQPEKNVRMGIWIPISALVLFVLVAGVFMGIQSAGHCSDPRPEGQLWSCDFSGMDLSGRDLHGANMRNADLTGANLSRCDLSGAQLLAAHLRGANLAGADLSAASLIEGELDEADLSGTILDGANLTRASLLNVKGLTAESLANLSDWQAMLLQDEDEMLAQLSPVCSGKAVGSAADYLPEQYASSIMLIDEAGAKHSMTEGALYGTYWLPESVSNTELVACFSAPVHVRVGSCSYDDGTSWDRSVQRVEISVYAARTGELLETIVLEGARPGECPAKKPARAEYPDDIGDAPYGGAIIEALRPFVQEDRDRPVLSLP